MTRPMRKGKSVSICSCKPKQRPRGGKPSPNQAGVSAESLENSARTLTAMHKSTGRCAGHCLIGCGAWTEGTAVDCFFRCTFISEEQERFYNNVYMVFLQKREAIRVFLCLKIWENRMVMELLRRFFPKATVFFVCVCVAFW